MTTKQNCDDWIDYAYDNWLVAWIRNLPENSYLSESSQNMIDRMKAASSSVRTEEAWNLLERLKRLSDTFYGVGKGEQFSEYQKERSEVYLECALVAYKMGDLQEAKKLFHVSTDGFQVRDLHKAVSYWFLGCVQWQLPAHSEAAVVSWERSLQIIKKVDFSDQDKEANRREDVSECMRSAINMATMSGYPHPPPSASSGAVSANTRTSANSKPAARTSTLSPARLKFLPYFGSIPAGDPAVVDNHSDMVDVDALEIEGCSYKIYGIRNEREIRMKPSSRYFLAKADGHSMNIAEPVNIEDEDYVLLHNTQEAKNNDIVAAVVFGNGELETATLKRYMVEYGRRILRFESDKEKREIPMTERDYIQGVVVAVLKPADD